MPHDLAHGRDVPADHLHSHVTLEDEAADLGALAAQFVDGFRAAADKAAFLRLTGVPMEIPSEDGGPPLKLVDVRLATAWQVATASPSFGARELTHLPFTADMIAPREDMSLTYVSLDAKRVVDVREFLRDRGR